MSPQRRTALVSVVAACVLISLKLATGLASGSLGLVSEAVHSGTDLVAALLTLFAVGVSGRPADRGHPYGHGKAEHLAALAEAGILVLASLYISYRSLAVLVGSAESNVNPVWYVFVVVLIVIAVDASRATVSLRASRRYRSPALASNALHFASDLVGSTAVLIGLLLARAGWLEGDAVAALFVAALVLIAAYRLMRGNVDVLMDRVPVDAERAALAAIEQLEPGVKLRRLRMRQAAGATSRTSSSASRQMQVWVRVMPPRTRSRPPCRAHCPRATSSSTSSLPRKTRPSANGSSPPRSPSRASGRCTTSAWSRSTTASRWLSISSCRKT